MTDSSADPTRRRSRPWGTSTAPDPEAWALGLDLAHGDASLLEVDHDGRSVRVRNSRR